MTPALSLYLLAAARAEPLMTRRPERTPANTTVQESARAAGEMVWLHLAAGQSPDSAATLASRILDERPTTSFVMTSDAPVHLEPGFPTPVRPADYPRAVANFLEEWRPDVCIWIGGPIWPVLAAKAAQADVPMLLVNATAQQASTHRGISARDLLGLFETIVACDAASGAALERVTRRKVAVIGSLQRSQRPLDCDEAEHLRLRQAIQTRPVWYAAAATQSEIEIICDAHAVGQRAWHRLLLIIQPVDPAAAWPVLSRHGTRRSADHLPPAGASIFVADLPGEEGLWYRLASVSFIGGTLDETGRATDPFAAAALGSAILHGPNAAPFATHFAALSDVGATRRVRNPVSLGQAVADLLAPDRAAALATRAWDVVSEGAEATDHVVEEVGRVLDRPR